MLTVRSPLSLPQALHTTATSQSQQGAGDKGPGIPKPRQPAAAPLQSLAETLAAVAQTSDQPTPATPSTSARITPRTWVWYDARDEITWQRLELAKQYPHTGVATLNNAHVSPKKINRVLPMVSAQTPCQHAVVLQQHSVCAILACLGLSSKQTLTQSRHFAVIAA